MCPVDAEIEVQVEADYILKNAGGKRVVREVCEFILKHNKRF
jgi:3-deoxy-D-manno-octulosonate 8-phosphate phosphatase KdsC-like HAD superfamily phosphatase